MPGVVAKIPRMLFDSQAPLVIRWGQIPRLIPWFLRFVAASRPQRVETISDARAAILKHIFDAYEPLIEASGAGALVMRVGKLFVWENANGLKGARYALDLRRRRGVEVIELDGDGVRQYEPALGPGIACGVFFPDVRHVADPHRFVQLLAKRFEDDGGILLRERVTGFAIGRRGPETVITEAGRHPVERVVLAAGAWSRPLARKLGSRIPLVAQRGYHSMLAEPGIDLRRPFTCANRNIAVTPMAHGIRVTGIAEFEDVDAPGHFERANLALGHAKAILPDLNVDVASQWVGSRPSMPDSLPVIGPSPRYPNVFFAFGHDTIGMALGAITGRMIAEAVSGHPSTVDPGPFRVDRF